MRMGVADVRERRNWKMVDWEDFNKRLKEKMSELELPKEIEIEAEFWKVLEGLDKAVEEVVKRKYKWSSQAQSIDDGGTKRYQR